MLMQQHFAQLLHLSEVDFCASEKTMSFPELLLLLLLLQLRAADGLQLLQNQTELKNFNDVNRLVCQSFLEALL
jgi:hypothetical protein